MSADVVKQSKALIHSYYRTANVNKSHSVNFNNGISTDRVNFLSCFQDLSAANGNVCLGLTALTLPSATRGKIACLCSLLSLSF